MASKPNLTGEMYWNQLIQAWMFPALANYPPKRMIGYMMIGARLTAVSSLLKMLDMKYPKEAAH